MSADRDTRREELRRELAELEDESYEEQAAATDDVHETVSEHEALAEHEDAVSEAEQQTEQAIESVADTAEQVEEVAQEAAQEVAQEAGHPEDAEGIAAAVIARLESEGRLLSATSDGATVDADIVEAPVAAVVESVPGEATREAADTVRPRSEHWYYKRRSLLGREL